MEEQQESTKTLRTGFTLGSWTVLPNQNRIEADGESEHLEPKVMDVLCALAAEQGEVVSRAQLLEDVWAGTYVTDEVLSRAISMLRASLGDDSKNPEYIATVPKSGYRLIMPVVSLAPPPVAQTAVDIAAELLLDRLLQLGCNQGSYTQADGRGTHRQDDKLGE